MKKKGKIKDSITITGLIGGVADLTGNLKNIQSILEPLLRRLEALEATNNLLQEEVETLRSNDVQQEQINLNLQTAANSSHNRLRVLETNLQSVEGDLQGNKRWRMRNLPHREGIANVCGNERLTPERPCGHGIYHTEQAK